MINQTQAASVNQLVFQFASENGAMNDDAAAIAGKMISAVLHWAMRSGETDGDDGRKTALSSARTGLTSFVADLHKIDDVQIEPYCYALITIRTEGGLWVSETGFEEMVQ